MTAVSIALTGTCAGAAANVIATVVPTGGMVGYKTDNYKPYESEVFIWYFLFNTYSE